MTEQLALMPDPIDEAFFAFHHTNPHVYDELVRRAREWRDAGHDRCSIGMLFEVLRWDEGIRTTSGDGLKLNNNFRSRYVRIICANEPDLAPMFETRSLRGVA